MSDAYEIEIKSKDRFNRAVVDRLRDITAAQEWANEYREVIVAELKRRGFDDKFIGGHFLTWAHRYGVYQ